MNLSLFTASSRGRAAIALLLLSALTLAGFALAQEPHPAPSNYNPSVAKASDEGLKAIPRIAVPQGLKVELFAAEPHLANPVAFCIDEKGRFFVAETFRHSSGVTDNRSHGEWLNDDLASRTVADRLAMLKKFSKDKFDSTYAAERDRVKLVEDKDGDGKADFSSVFADDFHGHVDGIGSGLLARDGNVYFTCIPDLWLLRDENNDGKAEIKKSLQHGYGVHVAFIGHDLHGLRMGPDGKLYFTVGDRGLNVKQGERTIAAPDEGAVLRCDLDGSNLEIVATGLRNPQELAFDDYGNLFTCDNNSDSGDRARWVHIVEGGDSGWRISYQYHDRPVARGPWNAEMLWNAEKQWNHQYDGYAHYILPPLANISDGPSGLCHYPGTGLPIRYNGHFFLSDFRGSSGASGVRSFSVKPKGATFEPTDMHEFAWKVLATDCDFGPDGGLYISDWVEGWNKPGKGRIYRVFDPVLNQTPVVQEVSKLLKGGLAKKSNDELGALLKHQDQRVRQEAQFALAKQGQAAIPVFLKAAEDLEVPLGRIHALWGMGQVAGKSADIEKIVPFLIGPDAEVRAQTLKVLASAAPSERLAEQVKPFLKADSARVKFFAAMAYGNLGRSAQPLASSNPDALAPIYEFLRSNNDADPYLRHAGVMALTWRNDPAALALAVRDPSPAVRMGVCLAMRRLADPRVAEFLHDIDPRVVLEAARAINDVPIEKAMPELAALATKTGISEHVQRRALNAQFRLGEAKNAAAVAAVAARLGAPESIRVEALAMLGDWEKPPGRDRVLGLWRPLPARSPGIAAAALRPVFAGTLSGPDKVRQGAVHLAGQLGIKDVGPTLFAQLENPKSSPGVRVESLKALEALKDSKLGEGMKLALADADPRVRAEGRRVMSAVDPAGAVEKLRDAMDKGELVERQGALTTLAGLKSPDADQILAGWLDKLVEGQVPPALALDVLEAARGKKTAGIPEKLTKYESARPKDMLGKYRECLEGGDAEHGKRIFLERAQVQCQRCHKVAGVGGEVGPDLSDIGGKQKREYLLEALVDPNKAIAKGFETVIVETSAGQVVVGVLKEETAKELRLITAEGRPIVVPKADIESRSQGKSAMPEQIRDQLSPRDLRDLVEFLSVQKK